MTNKRIRGGTWPLVVILLCAGGAVQAKPDIEAAGDVTQIAVPLYALGFALYSEEDRAGKTEAATQWGYSYAATLGTVHVLKLVIPAKRPDYEPGDPKNSFPSGHTASAFSGATFIYRRYGWQHAVVPYAFAAFTGYSRVHAERHHVRDVLAGAAIAAGWSWTMADEKSPVLLSLDAGRVALSWSVQF